MSFIIILNLDKNGGSSEQPKKILHDGTQKCVLTTGLANFFKALVTPSCGNNILHKGIFKKGIIQKGISIYADVYKYFSTQSYDKKSNIYPFTICNINLCSVCCDKLLS